MRIYDLLDDDTRKQLQAKPVHRLEQRKNEHLSRKEWHDIMGVNRDRYKRVNGKVKRR